MLNKKPIILATGCSFTDPKFCSRHNHLPDEKRGGWPMWPELIKEKIEKETGISYDLINLARSGGSQDWVFNTCLDTLSGYDGRIKIVLVGGTQWMRTHIIPTHRNHNPQAALVDLNENKEPWLKTYNRATVEMWSKYSTKFAIQETIYHNLRIMWTLAQICNNKKIKFIWNQLLCPFPGGTWWKKQFIEYGIPEEEIRVDIEAFSESFFADTVLKSPYAKFLVQNKKQFYGFPWSQGVHWDKNTMLNKERHPEIVLPTTVINGKKETDSHPSKYGQEKIAEQMWKEYGNYLVKN